MKLNLKLLATRFFQAKEEPPVPEDGVNRYLLEYVLRPNLEGNLLRLGDIDFDAFDADDVPALEDYYQFLRCFFHKKSSFQSSLLPALILD